MVKWLAIAIIAISLLVVNYDFIDVKEAVSYYGQSISQNYPLVGVTCFILLLFFTILPKEISNNWNHLKSKIKIKENF